MRQVNHSLHTFIFMLASLACGILFATLIVFLLCIAAAPYDEGLADFIKIFKICAGGF